MIELKLKLKKVEDSVDWEIAAHTDIEEFVRNDDAKTDIKDDAMRTYLTNTNLISKMVMSAKKSVSVKSKNCVETKI